MTRSDGDFDPFRLSAYGSRPSLAAYWPDTTFIELNPASAYLDTMATGAAAGTAERTALDAKLAVALSVIQHENVHRWISHVRSWGIQRRLLDIIQLDLLGVFLHSLDEATLARVAVGEMAGGGALLDRARNFDVVIDPTWSGTTHSTGEHAWLCTILRAIIDHGHHRLSRLRPPEYMYGVLARYLAAGGDVLRVLAEDNAQFQDTVRAYKSWQAPAARLFPPELRPGDDLFEAIETALPSAAAIEECQAVIAQFLYYSGSGDWAGKAGAPIVAAFNRDLWRTISGPQGALYSAAFAFFALVTGCTFEAGNDPDRRHVTMLSIICDLALNPPLGFDRDGLPAVQGWAEVHPSLRFAALCRACSKLPRRKWTSHDDLDASAYRRVSATLLHDAKLQIAEPKDLSRLIALFADTYAAKGYYPIKESLRLFQSTASAGFALLDRHPRLLMDPWGEMAALGGEPANPDGFFDPPFLIIDGEPHGEGLSEKVYFSHVYGWSIARVVRGMVFDRGPISFAGLPGGDTSLLLRRQARDWCIETFLGRQAAPI